MSWSLSGKMIVSANEVQKLRARFDAQKVTDAVEAAIKDDLRHILTKAIHWLPEGTECSYSAFGSSTVQAEGKVYQSFKCEMSPSHPQPAKAVVDEEGG